MKTVVLFPIDLNERANDLNDLAAKAMRATGTVVRLTSRRLIRLYQRVDWFDLKAAHNI